MTPSPSQAGQAPNGLLNENSRGSISAMVKPETGQANFSEKVSRSPVSAFSAKAMPSASPSAVSMRIRQPVAQALAHHDAVDHHVDVVLELLVERGYRVDLVQGAVDLDPLEAALLQLGELLAVLALAAAHDRRQQVEPGAFGQRHHPVDHLA